MGDKYKSKEVEEDASPFGMEIGNLLWGNSRGNFKVDREFVSIFTELLDVCGCDSYGCVCTQDCKYPQFIQDDGSFKTKTFCIRSYYWGDDESLALLHNFEFYPENIEIDWYKYPFRDSYSNIELTEEKFKDIVKQCILSLDKEEEEVSIE